MTFPRVRATSVLATTAKYLLHLFHLVPIEVTSHVWTTQETTRERERIRIRLWIKTASRLVVRGSCSSGERFREGIATVSGCSGPSGPCFVWALEDSSSCAWTHQTRALPALSPPWPSCVKNLSLRSWQKGWRQGTRLGISEGITQQERDSLTIIDNLIYIYIIYSSSTIFRVIEGIQQNPNFQRQLHYITFAQIISDTLQAVSN